MYDATFTGLWQWLEVIMMEVAQQELSKVEGKNISIDATMVYAQSKVAKSICSTAQQYCVGVLQQYENASECYEYLTNVTRFGEAYELGTHFYGFFLVKVTLIWATGRNTLQCRMVHQTMVPLRPEVHCPHIGPSGGGYCDDTPSYADTLEAKYFTNYKFAYGNGSLSG